MPSAPYQSEGPFRLSIMDRYIITELIPVFLFGVAAFSSIGVAIGALFDLVRKVTESGVPVSLAVQILLLKMPEFIGYSFPMSTLLAALMTYSRFSSDSELVALRSCGISVYRLVVPAVMVSFLVTGMTFAFNEVVVPGANYQASVTLERALKQEKPDFQEKNILYQDFREIKLADGGSAQELDRLFFAQEFDGQRMKNLSILDYSQKGLNQIVVAESATWNFAKNTWDFSNGTIYIIAPDGSYRNIIRFEKQELQLPRAPLDLATRGRDYGEMNIADSQSYLALLRQSGDLQKVRKLEVVIQKKYALPFVCVVFGLIGSVLGTRPQRTSRAKGFGLSILIIFGYYLFGVICEALGYTGLFNPFMAGWFPNMLGLSVGILLLSRASR
ncbi:LptF/LptG family permease [Leptolyngbya sp. 'hensonii']|uniref:LptF/LptG family permease n=1 Tax=Leptolyngbya sp. 'hensonii' TaxID=1922337 RepID=UPI000AEDE6C6|nr:LptF/LptG family permease [Leptolyngbya sp. 'hensonii']